MTSLGEPLTVKEICAQLNLGKSSVYRMLAEGIISSRKVGPRAGKYIVVQADVDHYVESTRLPKRET